MTSTDRPGSEERPSARSEPSLLELTNAVLSRWKVVVAVPAVATAITILVLLFFVDTTYTASAVFVPETNTSGRLPSSIAGLAGQFGVSWGEDASQSPEFYVSLAKTQAILDKVLLTRFRDPRGVVNDSATLLAILEIDGDSLADRLHNGRESLRSRLTIALDHRTGILSLAFTCEHQMLVADVANRVVAYLDEFNAVTRQSQARERRLFTEGRLAEAEAVLRGLDEKLRTFYERNRTWQQSPQLSFERERLQRDIQMTQELVTALRREFEAARIQEVNDTPVITVVSPATIPQEKSGPMRRRWVMAIAALSGVLGVFLALVAELISWLRRSEPTQYQLLRSHLDAALAAPRAILRRRTR